MNERLFELIQSQNGLCGLLWSEEDKQEFAELIVFECVKLAVFKGDSSTGRAIKQHFGVEQ